MLNAEHGMFLCTYNHSTIIPERLDAFINRYAEYTHDKWAFEKVGVVFLLQIGKSRVWSQQPCVGGLRI